MKIISWNVNSVRARIENIKNYIKDSAPDILLLQEIKTQNINFPNDEFKNLGYTSYVFGQKSYNGVAIISKHELDKINNKFIKDDLNQSRIITAEVKLNKKKIELINIYAPNGNPVDTEKYEYKKSWLKKFILKSNETIFIPAKSIHRIENPYKKPVKIIEAQLGSILKESDIVRYQDIYGRVK